MVQRCNTILVLSHTKALSEAWDRRASPRMSDCYQAGLEDVIVSDTHEICSPSSQCGTQAAITIFLARGRKPAAQKIE
jgi:hypothetical protein